MFEIKLQLFGGRGGSGGSGFGGGRSWEVEDELRERGIYPRGKLGEKLQIGFGSGNEKLPMGAAAIADLLESEGYFGNSNGYMYGDHGLMVPNRTGWRISIDNIKDQGDHINHEVSVSWYKPGSKSPAGQKTVLLDTRGYIAIDPDTHHSYQSQYSPKETWHKNPTEKWSKALSDQEKYYKRKK